ncbi:MAG TPA: sigma-54 dependent transcriptional regulator [Acidobacteriota bacterium]|nr:sigma-54 dependent transcriptional regulator [Acidobacteriota bacterium]
MEKILIVDDERSMRDFLRKMLEKQDYEVKAVGSGADAIAELERDGIDLMITDIKMPDISGIELMERCKKISPDTVVIVITAYASHDTAVEAMKLGAEDYITKPFDVDEFSIIIRRSLTRKRLAEENILLRRELQREHRFENIIGKSRPMIELFRLIERVASTPSTVLITGESGTGKELVARAIHYNSPRFEHPFVSINCGALPETLLESELFGHERGSFTGADRTKTGLFESAGGGTLFLDEIGNTPMSMQVKLLRAMQERRVRRVGGTEERPIDVRIITATNVDLEKMVEQGGFREDLYYRVNVIKIDLPPLRKRREDVMLLALHFLDKYAAAAGRPIRGFADSARRGLENYSWPGNVRELENAIERAVALETGEVITSASLPDQIGSAKMAATGEALEIPEGGFDLERHLEEQRRKYLKIAMEMAEGKQTKAARLLGLSTRSIRYLLDKFNMK